LNQANRTNIYFSRQITIFRFEIKGLTDSLKKKLDEQELNGPGPTVLGWPI
jgi:hypothetical protein